MVKNPAMAIAAIFLFVGGLIVASDDTNTFNRRDGLWFGWVLAVVGLAWLALVVDRFWKENYGSKVRWYVVSGTLAIGVAVAAISALSNWNRNYYGWTTGDRNFWLPENEWYRKAYYHHLYVEEQATFTFYGQLSIGLAIIGIGLWVAGIVKVFKN